MLAEGAIYLFKDTFLIGVKTVQPTMKSLYISNHSANMKLCTCLKLAQGTGGNQVVLPQNKLIKEIASLRLLTFLFSTSLRFPKKKLSLYERHTLSHFKY